MTTTAGFSGKRLRVDLSSRQISIEELQPDDVQQFIGGLGLAIKAAFDHIQPGTSALAPENPVIIGAGALVGTDIPSASRMYAVSKLPSSNTIGWCGAGGVVFGAMLKTAGLDQIIIEGRSDIPVYLKIIDDRIELCPAGTLWGTGVSTACRQLKKTLPAPAGVLTIGQAGENQITFAMASVDGVATLGRGGLGAVLGAKQLKAIVVQGSKGVTVADPPAYKELRQNLLEKIRNYPHLKKRQQLGMMTAWPLIPIETYQSIKKRRIACISCPLGCKDLIELPDGPYKGQQIASSSAVNLFMPMVYGFQDYREAARLIATLDDYGLDMFEFFGLMTFMASLYKHNIIKRTADTPEVDITSLASMEAWAEKIVVRTGPGRLLAEGFSGVLDKYKEDAHALAPAIIKNMHPYSGPGSALPWDLFGTMELGQILELRGPHVGSGGSPTYFAKRPLAVFPRHLQRMGVPEKTIRRIIPDSNAPPNSEELKIGALLKYSHRWFTILGSLGICAREQVNRFYNADLCAALYAAVTGIPTTTTDLNQKADRIWTLYKLMNVREGVNASAEAIPERWVTAPGFKHYLSEQPLTREAIQQMIADYYQEQGWDPATGIPTEESLKKLDIQRVD